VRNSGALPVSPGDGSKGLVDLSSENTPFRRQGQGQCQGAVTGEGSDLEAAVRVYQTVALMATSRDRLGVRGRRGRQERPFVRKL